jgi:hypothetical protein
MKASALFALFTLAALTGDPKIPIASSGGDRK